MGRRKLDEQTQRGAWVTVRMTRGEKAALERAAGAGRGRLAKFVRRILVAAARRATRTVKETGDAD